MTYDTTIDVLRGVGDGAATVRRSEGLVAMMEAQLGGSFTPDMVFHKLFLGPANVEFVMRKATQLALVDVRGRLSKEYQPFIVPYAGMTTRMRTKWLEVGQQYVGTLRNLRREVVDGERSHQDGADATMEMLSVANARIIEELVTMVQVEIQNIAVSRRREEEGDADPTRRDDGGRDAAREVKDEEFGEYFEGERNRGMVFSATRKPGRGDAVFRRGMMAQRASHY